MKTNLKLIAIGIIILYCLTPLGAVEINTCDTKIGEQTTDATGAANAHNETKVVNNTDNTDAQTDVRDDVDTKTSVKDNARDSNSTIATKEVGKTAKDSNDNQNYMFDTDMEVYAEDTCAGSPIKVHCTAHNHQNPNDTRITGRISISANGTVLGYGEMINGKADIQLTHQLKTGNYILNAHYFTNDKYSPADATTTLTVKGEHANLNIKVNNVTPTGDATIDITTNKEINNESVSVKLDSTSSVYDVKITNGEGKLNVHNLKLGTHTVTANYHGNEKFRPDNASATFTVAKYDANLNIKVHDITPSGDATIDITTNKEINNEFIPVKVDHHHAYIGVKITNGEGKLTVHNLELGNHTAIANYQGNEKFYPDSASATFTVAKYDPNLNIEVNNVTPTGDATIDITTNKKMDNETVTVKLDSSSNIYNVKITKGEGKLNVHNLKLGKHVVVAEYGGNEKFLPDNTSATFTVAKYDPDLKIKVHNVTPTGDATIDITTNKEINNESVSVKLDSSSNIYNVKITKGEGKLNVHNLKLGKHTVTVNYPGNEKFLPDNASATFTVAKYDPDLKIKVHNVTADGDAVIDVTTDKRIDDEDVVVRITSSSNTCSIKLKNGECRMYVHDLTPGKHEVIAIYGGNENFKFEYTSTTLTVKSDLDPNLGVHFTNITEGQNPLAEITANKNLSGNIDAKLNTCNNPLAVSNSKLHSTTGNNTTTTVNPKTAGQYPLLQA